MNKMFAGLLYSAVALAFVGMAQPAEAQVIFPPLPPGFPAANNVSSVVVEGLVGTSPQGLGIVGWINIHNKDGSNYQFMWYPWTPLTKDEVCSVVQKTYPAGMEDAMYLEQVGYQNVTTNLTNPQDWCVPNGNAVQWQITNTMASGQTALVLEDLTQGGAGWIPVKTDTYTNTGGCTAAAADLTYFCQTQEKGCAGVVKDNYVCQIGGIGMGTGY